MPIADVKKSVHAHMGCGTAGNRRHGLFLEYGICPCDAKRFGAMRYVLGDRERVGSPSGPEKEPE